MPESSSPELDVELQRLREMAEQLRAALAVIKQQIDASTAAREADDPAAPAAEPAIEPRAQD